MNNLKIEKMGNDGISENDLPPFNNFSSSLLNSSNIFINSTLNEIRKRSKKQPTSPLNRPRVEELRPHTINDEWPWYNTSETYNVTEREIEEEGYDYRGPQAVHHTTYYSRPAYDKALCTQGPDDIQHNQICLFSSANTLVGESEYALPSGWIWDVQRNEWIA